MRYQLSDLTINTDTQEVIKGKQPLDIQGLNFKLLHYLLRRGTEICSFDELMDGVWHPSQVNNETVTQRVRLLRVALEDTEKQPRYIRTVRGQGYQLCVKPLVLPLDKGAKALKPQTLAAVIAGLIAIALALFVGFQQPPTALESSPYQQKLSRAEYYAQIGQLDDLDRAMSMLSNIEKEGIRDPRWLVNKSFVLSLRVCRYGASFEDAKQAAQLAHEAIKLAPDRPHPHQALAYANDCMGHTQEAIRWYRSAVVLDPQLQTGSLSSLAYLLTETGELAEALEINLRLLKNNPDESYTALQLGHTYALMEHTALAEYYLSTSFELYPDNVFSNLALPRFLWQQGRTEEAKTYLAEALRRPQHADLWWLKADIHLAEGDVDLTQQALQKASALKPEATIYQTLLTLVQDDAISIRARLDQLPDTGANSGPLALLEKAVILASLQDYEAATTMLKEAVKSGFLDSQFLQRSAFFTPLRSLPDYSAILAQIRSRVAAQRANVPASALQLPKG